MAKLKKLEDFFEEELKDLYNAEKQLTKALPKLAKTANSSELKKAFEDHLAETENQIDRLEKIGKSLKITLTGKKCKAMEGLLAEGDEIMKENATPGVKDAALIAASQKVEHYEIATYGCLVAYSKALEYSGVCDLLEESIKEEGNADKTLTKISKKVNKSAL